jgi:hypothetical protein
MATSTFQAAKLEVVSLFELSKDALHIYVGLLVFIAATVLLRRSLRSSLPILLVLVVACIAEAFDARDDISDLGYWRIGASMHDIVNTMFWPAILFALARYTKVLR